jgi:hypothetical protein
MAEEEKPTKLTPGPIDNQGEGNNGDAESTIIPPSQNNADRLDRVAKHSGFAKPKSAVSEVFFGLDHRDAGSSFQKNTDHQGLTLFTRPQLNLSYDNVLADRTLTSLLDKNPLSMYAAIRGLLDPRLAGVSNLIDPRNAFIPILTNTLMNISGFPDVTLDTYTSPEGMRQESYSIVDSIADINNSYDLTATFANVQGDPVTALFHFWTRYASNVYTGRMVPYPEKIVENEVDYQTRIWRLVLDGSKRYVKKIGCANVAFPVASPLGASFNYSKDTPYINENDQISIPFRCMGAEYNDPILISEFNATVASFNNAMWNPSQKGYRKLSRYEISGYNYEGYPRINLETMELEWWVVNSRLNPNANSGR